LLKILYPKMYVSSILEIKLETLKELGIKGILFDLDNTIVRRDSVKFSPEVQGMLEEFKRQGFKLGIVSNNSHKRVGSIAGPMEVTSVHRAVKPWVRPFRHALKLINTAPEETALIGDQIFTDILGGNLAGLYTILVVPMEGKEFWGTRMISRPLEKFVLAKLKKHPEVFHGKWD